MVCALSCGLVYPKHQPCTPITDKIPYPKGVIFALFGILLGGGAQMNHVGGPRGPPDLVFDFHGAAMARLAEWLRLRTQDRRYEGSKPMKSEFFFIFPGEACAYAPRGGVRL